MIVNGRILGEVPGWTDGKDGCIAKFPDQLLVGVLRRVVRHARGGEVFGTHPGPHNDVSHFRR